MLIKMENPSGGGSSQVATGYGATMASLTGASGQKVTLGFKPKQIYITARFNGSQLWYIQSYYNADNTENSYTSYSSYTTAAASSETVNLPNSSANTLLNSVDNDGFTMGSGYISSATNIGYIAVG